MTADLSALIARLEAAEAGSRELDEAIHDALCDDKFRSCIAGLSDEQGGLWMYEFEGHVPSSALRVTQSLDAALALAERVLPGEEWMIVKSTEGGETSFHALIGPDSLGRAGEAASAALALCIALLRAKQGEG